jgi:hypothetical protein
MTSPCGIDQHLIEVIIRSPGRALDDMVLECPELTWNQIFLTIDRLSREGALTLTPKGRGVYTLHCSDHAPAERGGVPCACSS